MLRDGTTATNTARLEKALLAYPDIAAHLERLDAARESAWSDMDAAWRRQDQAREDKRGAEAELAKLERADRSGHLLKEKRSETSGQSEAGPLAAAVATGVTLERDDERLTEARARVKAAGERLARSRAMHEAAAAVWNDAKAVHDAAERYLASVPKFERWEEKGEKPAKGETAAEGAAKLRVEIGTLAEEVKRVRSAPLPSSQLLDRARADVSALAAEGRPRLDRNGAVLWPRHLIGSVSHVNSLAVIAWLFKDELDEAISSLAPDSPDAMTEAERDARLAELADLMLSLERREESLIRLSETKGAHIARRGQADPRAVLAIVGPAPRD